MQRGSMLLYAVSIALFVLVTGMCMLGSMTHPHESRRLFSDAPLQETASNKLFRSQPVVAGPVPDIWGSGGSLSTVPDGQQEATANEVDRIGGHQTQLGKLQMIVGEMGLPGGLLGEGHKALLQNHTIQGGTYMAVTALTVDNLPTLQAYLAEIELDEKNMQAPPLLLKQAKYPRRW